MSIELPQPIHRYFETDSSKDTAGMADVFATDAVVIDENKRHEGLAAIKAWKQQAKATTSYRVTPLDAGLDGPRYVVKGHVEGNFPGSPVQLRYVFTLVGDRIASLEIRP